MQRWSLLSAALFVGACTFGDSGIVGSGQGLATSSDGDASASGGTTTTAGAATDGGGNGSASGDTPTVASTGEPPATDETSAGGSDGVADSSTSAPLDTGTDGSDTDATTTGPARPAYPPCPSGQDSECGPGFNCVPNVDGQTITASYCGSIDCVPNGSVEACPDPTTGNATVQCVSLSTPVCTLFCENGETCPDGMSCIGVSFNGMALTQVCNWEQ